MAVKKYQDQLKVKKRKTRFYKLLAAAGVVFLLLIGLVYVLFFAKLFDVRDIVISGNDKISKTDIENSVNSWLGASFWKISRRSNYMFFTSDDLATVLMKKFPEIETLNVGKKSVHEVDITMTERKPVGIWCLTKKESCFYFDKNNLAYQKTGASRGFIFTIINDYRDREIQIGSAVEEAIWPGNIFIAKDELQKNGIDVVEFSIPSDSFDEFDASAVLSGQSSGKNNWQILFSNSTDISKQITAFAGLIKNKLTHDDLANLKYVDLRVPGRIYYK